MNRTHVEVSKANKGANVWNLFDGQMLKVLKETPKFVFVESWEGKQIKISKHTKQCCYWSQKNTSPIFNI